MAGGFWLAQRGQVTGLTSRVVLALLLLALALIGFAATNLFVFALACLLITGFAVIVIGVGEQTLLQVQSIRDARPGDEPLRNDWPRLRRLARLSWDPWQKCLASRRRFSAARSCCSSYGGGLASSSAAWLEPWKENVRRSPCGSAFPSFTVTTPCENGISISRYFSAFQIIISKSGMTRFSPSSTP